MKRRINRQNAKSLNRIAFDEMMANKLGYFFPTTVLIWLLKPYGE